MTDNSRMAIKKPKGLGMGLEALLGPKAVAEVSTEVAARQPTSLKLAQLQPGKYQPRTRMDEGSLYELAQSIRSQGVMQPILVRPVAPGRYEIIAGERRFRAAKLAELEEVPVLVKPVPDEAAAVMALIENIQREDLNPLEEAQGLKRLVDDFGLTHEQAAQAVGRSRSAASNLLRLLNLAEPVQKLLMAGDVDMGHARALLPLAPAQQILAAHEIVARSLSVREAEKLVARSQQTAAQNAAQAAGQKLGPTGPTAGAAAAGAAQREPASQARDLARLEEQLADKLTAEVQIKLQPTRGAGSGARAATRGEVVIRFSSLDELSSLLDKLGVSER